MVTRGCMAGPRVIFNPTKNRGYFTSTLFSERDRNSTVLSIPKRREYKIKWRRVPTSNSTMPVAGCLVWDSHWLSSVYPAPTEHLLPLRWARYSRGDFRRRSRESQALHLAMPLLPTITEFQGLCSYHAWRLHAWAISSSLDFDGIGLRPSSFPFVPRNKSEKQNKRSPTRSARQLSGPSWEQLLNHRWDEVPWMVYTCTLSLPRGPPAAT